MTRRWINIAIALAILAVVTGWFHKPGAGIREIPVLLFHQIGKGRENYLFTWKRFVWLTAYLKRHHFNVLTLDQFLAVKDKHRPAPARPVLITFDDGERSIYSKAWPLLKANNLPFVLFANPGFIGKKIYMKVSNRGYYMAPEPGTVPLQMLSWAELKEMVRGGASIQSHSLRHRELCRMAPQKLIQDLEQSKQLLEEHLGTVVKSVSYPWGESTPALQALVKSQGYTSAFVCRLPDLNVPDPYNRFAMKRHIISTFTSRSDLVIILWGWMPLRENVYFWIKQLIGYNYLKKMLKLSGLIS